MRAADVAALYRAAEAAGVTLWLDGGWGVDALLGRETRAHEDLDVVVRVEELDALRVLLDARGFREVTTADAAPWNFVMADDAGRAVDLHVIVVDAAGDGIYGPPERGMVYPQAALGGRGRVGDVEVRCVTAAFQVASRRGYAIRPKDLADLEALRQRFGPL